MLTPFAIVPDGYPNELDEYVMLPNGRQVHVRALHREEEAPIRMLDAHLSVRTRYLRFLSPLPALPDSLIRLLAGVDYSGRLALVAEHQCGRSNEAIALGSFSAVDGTSAEIGLVVRDDWQRQRVGTALFMRVLHAAESRGYRRFIGHLLPENVAIRKLLRAAGEVVAARVSGGVSEIAFVRRVASAE
jgi:GNAT superfamily N-acetyltransferase